MTEDFIEDMRTKYEKKIEALRLKLDNCRKAAGSDVDCDPLDAVKELRKDYDAAGEEAEALRARIKVLEEMERQVMDGSHPNFKELIDEINRQAEG